MKKTLLLMVLVAIFNLPAFSQFVENAPCTITDKSYRIKLKGGCL